MANAIVKLFQADARADLIARGLRQAAEFTFATMAAQMAAAFVATHDRLRAGTLSHPHAVWTELRGVQRRYQADSVGISETRAGKGNDAEGPAAVPAGRPNASFELERALRRIDDMRKSPFWKARELTVRVLRKLGLR